MPTRREADLLAVALFTVEAGGTPPMPQILHLPSWQERSKNAYVALGMLENERYRSLAERLIDTACGTQEADDAA